MRYLAELAWAPDAIPCNRSLEWQVREDGFRVPHPSAHGRISVEIQLNEAGRIGSVSARTIDRAWRPAASSIGPGAAASRTTASAMADGHRFRGEVGWHLDGNWHPVWTVELTDWRFE